MRCGDSIAECTMRSGMGSPFSLRIERIPLRFKFEAKARNLA